jgi:regulator of protease activity HflC (stomatin/prohibitin superfamily)
VILLIPFVDCVIKMDLRVVTLSVPRQETKDNVPVTVDAVVYFRIVNPEAAVGQGRELLQGDLPRYCRSACH